MNLSNSNSMSQSIKTPKKSRGVCETLQYAPGGNKVEKAIFSFKVTRSLALVSFERASMSISGVCMPNMKSLSKVIAKVKVDNRH